MTPPKPDSDPRHPLGGLWAWAETEFGKRIFKIVLALSALGFGLYEVVGMHRHELPAPGEGTPLFYALFGFVSFAFVVLSGWPLRKLLGRPENFYEPKDDTSGGEKEDGRHG